MCVGFGIGTEGKCITDKDGFLMCRCYKEIEEETESEEKTE